MDAYLNYKKSKKTRPLSTIRHVKLHAWGRKSWTSFVCMFDVYVCMFRCVCMHVQNPRCLSWILNIHTYTSEHTYIHIEHTYKARSRFAPSCINLTWRIVDRGLTFIDLRSLDKLTCWKTPLSVVLFCYLRFKIFFCMLSKHVCMYVNVSKTLSLWRVFKSPLPVKGFWLRSLYVCMLSLYVCMLGHLEVPPLTNLKKLN